MFISWPTVAVFIMTMFAILADSPLGWAVCLIVFLVAINMRAREDEPRIELINADIPPEAASIASLMEATSLSGCQTPGNTSDKLTDATISIEPGANGVIAVDPKTKSSVPLTDPVFLMNTMLSTSGNGRPTRPRRPRLIADTRSSIANRVRQRHREHAS
jgi:hypothetical protein